MGKSGEEEESGDLCPDFYFCSAAHGVLVASVYLVVMVSVYTIATHFSDTEESSRKSLQVTTRPH